MSFAVGQKVTPITEIEWYIPRVHGQQKVDGPLLGGVYVVAGYDMRWEEPAIFFSEFLYDEDTPGYKSKYFRAITDEEFRVADEMIQKLMKKEAK